MSIIHILPEAVANKIAAGEVVERPASVVKELLENSLDAGAGRVEVCVEAGGKRRIRVLDDGCGMSHDDALLAFERHATSKIRSAEDLFEIATLGFRGEALPSIAAVSRLLLETRHTPEETGTRVEIVGGKLRDAKEIPWPRGTSLEVRDLFFNTPVRRRFMKSESTELGHIATLVTHYALAHPEKSFRLVSLTNEILNVSPVANLRERVYQVMGGQLLEQLLEITPVERRIPAATEPDPSQDAAAPEEAATLHLTGFVSRPEVQKLNRNQIYFFVNRRLVRDRLILHAITEAYRNILPASVFPVALILVDLPPAEVDVNVHPSKIEVRFRHSAFIHDFARDSIRQTLVAARPVAAFPLPKPGEGSRVPGQPAAFPHKRGAVQAGVQAEEEAEIRERLSEEAPLMGGSPVGTERPAPARGVPSSASRSGEFALSSPSAEPRTGVLPLEAAMSVYAPGMPAATGAEGCGTEVRPATSPASRTGAPPPSGDAGEFPADLQPLGQVQESFIVATNADGLWIVDQHVAHERILFERHLRLRREKKVEVQRLLLPIIVELKPEQQAVFQEMPEELWANGFEVEPFGRRTVAIKTAPAEIAPDHVERLLLEILDGIGQEARGVSLDLLLSKIAASIACHGAIKVNMALDRKKMSWLLQELGKTECPMACPHGRPIMLRYGMREIQKAFKRI
jgi:DNA mismatch repair protein MutL